VLYDSYEMQRTMLDAASVAATAAASWFSSPLNPLAYTGAGPLAASALEVFAHAARPYTKPSFGLATTQIGGREVKVTEEIIETRAFGRLLHFRREGRSGDPKLLIVAPMSGHFATLLRGTVERMLPSCDVHITDWADAKMVPLSDGVFDFDDYIDYVTGFLETMGPGCHVIAVCQPAVPVYAALALMGADKHPCTPVSATLMGGPIDPSKAPTQVNDVATDRPFSWFQKTVIMTVPMSYPGAGRRVYPGWVQLAGFLSMNLGNHIQSHWTMFRDLLEGDDESADVTKSFYEEYRSVADMDAAFYLQTVDVVFQRQLLPKGELMHRGRLVDPARIITPLLAIEGERDDISGLGQTRAGLDMATGLPATEKRYYMAEGAGHYGIFNGHRWRDQIAPVVEDWIAHWTTARAKSPLAIASAGAD
jgi:poly(3-hydroxybutyrate) depolymerase